MFDSGGSVIVALDCERLLGDIISILEVAAPASPEGSADVDDSEWTTSLYELERLTKVSEDEIDEAILLINKYVRSVKIYSRPSTSRGKDFRIEFLELQGSWVPFDGPYSTQIIKTVEKRIHIIEPVVVGDGLKQPQIGKTKQRPSKRTPSPFKEGDVIWAVGSVPEKIPGFIEPEFYQNMKSMVAWGRHPALEGPPGIGKSSAVTQLAAETGNVLVSVPGDAGFHKRDLTGIQQINDGKSVIMAAEYVTAAIKGWWCKIDEVNAADADALMYINSQTEEPFRVQLFGRTYPVHRDFRLFVTYNKGLVGTKMLPQATLDRFALFKVDYPGEDFLTKILILKGAVDMREVYILSEVARSLWSERLRYQLSPRRLFDAILLVRSNPSGKIENFIHSAILPYVWSEPEVATVNSLVSAAIVNGKRIFKIHEDELRDSENKEDAGEVVISREVLSQEVLK